MIITSLLMICMIVGIYGNENTDIDHILFNQDTDTTNKQSDKYTIPDYPIIELKDGNFLNVRGPFTGTSTSKWIDDIMKIESDEIYVYISSPGGSVIDGHNFISVVEALEQSGKSIVCVGDVSISMAYVLLQYCPVRYIRPSSVLMQHQMSLGLQGPIENVDSYFNFVKSMKDTLNSHQASRMNLTKEEFESRINNDWWMHGLTAIENNAADDVAHVLCHPNLSNKKVTTTVQTFFGPIDVVYSACPLARNPLEIKFSDSFLDNKEAMDTITKIFDMNNIFFNYNEIQKYIV